MTTRLKTHTAIGGRDQALRDPERLAAIVGIEAPDGKMYPLRPRVENIGDDIALIKRRSQKLGFINDDMGIFGRIRGPGSDCTRCLGHPLTAMKTSARTRIENRCQPQRSGVGFRFSNKMRGLPREHGTHKHDQASARHEHSFTILAKKARSRLCGDGFSDLPHPCSPCSLETMKIPSLDRHLRLPLVLALIMVGVFVINRIAVNRDHGFRDYGEQCGICHHGGRGQVSETPPLFGRIDQIASTPEGKHYIIDVLLNGVSGPITANGEHFDWAMPSFRRLSDEQIAGILTWVAAQGGRNATRNTPVFEAQDIARQRLPMHSAVQVRAEREALDQKYALP